MQKKTPKIIETWSNGYSSKSTQPELSYEYQQDRVWMVFRNLVIWRKVAVALEGLTTMWQTLESKLNPFNAKAIFIQSTKMQRFL